MPDEINDYIFDVNQAGTVVGRDSQTIRRWYGDDSFMQRYPSFITKIPNPAIGRDNVFVSASILAQVARDRGMLINREALQEYAGSKEEIVKLFDDIKAPEPPKQDLPKSEPMAQGQFFNNPDYVYIPKATLDALQKQLDEKDKQIAKFQEADYQQNVLFQNFQRQLMPPEPSVSKDQTELPLDQENEEKPPEIQEITKKQGKDTAKGGKPPKNANKQEVKKAEKKKGFIHWLTGK